MQISCIFAPTSHTPEHIELAETLGYTRAYCYDSPPIGPDVFVTLALAAQRTSRIGLAAGMVAPRLRHVVTTAAALATVHRLAPGRVVFGIGSGFTGSRLLGQRSTPWQYIHDYVRAVRALLRKDEVIWDGAPIKLLPSPDFETSLEDGLDLPVIVAADGPKGRAVARELNAGLCAGFPARYDDFEWLATPLFGTVLEDGESAESDRAFAAAGPGMALAYHLIYEFRGAEAVDQLPGGAAWRRHLENVPVDSRHLTLHRGHGHYVNELDREFMPRSMVRELTLTGRADEVCERVAQLQALGLTEIIFNPAGPDIRRELERFAAACMSLHDPSAISSRT